MTSYEAKQVSCKPKTAQGKQVRKAKQGASPSKALGEIGSQPCLSHEDKGKTPLSFGSVAYASREAEVGPQWRESLLASPNLKALFFQR